MCEKLNENEVKVLRAVREAIQIATDNEFGYFEDVLPLLPEFSTNQVKGYMSSLQKKRRIDISDDDFSNNPQSLIMMLDRNGGLISEIIDEKDWSWDLPPQVKESVKEKRSL